MDEKAYKPTQDETNKAAGMMTEEQSKASDNFESDKQKYEHLEDKVEEAQKEYDLAKAEAKFSGDFELAYTDTLRNYDAIAGHSDGLGFAIMRLSDNTFKTMFNESASGTILLHSLLDISKRQITISPSDNIKYDQVKYVWDLYLPVAMKFVTLREAKSNLSPLDKRKIAGPERSSLSQDDMLDVLAKIKVREKEAQDTLLGLS